MRRQIPNLVTFACLLLGFAALGAVLNSRSELAAAFLLLALLADGVSGQVARRKGSATPLGAELDSLASLMAFGVAVMVLAFERSLWQLGVWGWVVAVGVAVAVALRLSRDNESNPDWPRYQGLPVPAFGIIVGLLASIAPEHSRWLAGTSVLMAALMLSPFRWARVSNGNVAQVSLGLAVLLALVYPPFRLCLLGGALLYALFGAFFGFFGFLELDLRQAKASKARRR